MPQAGICAGLRQLGLIGVWPGIVGNQVKVLALGGGDTERLFHEAVRLVSVSVRLAVVRVHVTTAARIWRLAGASP